MTSRLFSLVTASMEDTVISSSLSSVQCLISVYFSLSEPLCIEPLHIYLPSTEQLWSSQLTGRDGTLRQRHLHSGIRWDLLKHLPVVNKFILRQVIQWCCRLSQSSVLKITCRPITLQHLLLSQWHMRGHRNIQTVFSLCTRSCQHHRNHLI